MPLATVEDVAARLGRPISSDESPRIEAFIADATGLIEDYCGRDLDRHTDEFLTLYAQGGRCLSVPPRHLTLMSITAVKVEDQAVTDWTFTGRQLLSDAGWPVGPVTVVASWGFLSSPPALKAVVCSEVMRWLAVSPGVTRERVGEVEVEFSGASSTQSLSALTRAALKPYRRRGVGVMTLRRAGPHVFGY
ncbi:phage gp6-like head-tail connector protein [Streptomyces sp. PsTaAH-124]|uniref:phage gp6-like head-tail connector protein n=1 Tax=Streptomyces sp. PsTaAH-124 TaxID=1157638 RepID=UPI000375A511|nr:phage gp6-like head-tail connector protein [Streptomyces sp. PsTaAH-124]